MVDPSQRQCSVCRAPLTQERNALSLRNSLAPVKRYCSPKCTRRAYYLRRKERDASRPVLIENPVSVEPSGWPATLPPAVDDIAQAGRSAR